ncbi:MAG: hypothetical protein AB1896_19910, partial [Thermodesulfobacteriota bacterium]
VYAGRAYAPAERTAAPLEAYSPGRTWQAESRANRQVLVLQELRLQSTRLAEDIRLFRIPDRGNLSFFRRAESSAPDKFAAVAADGTEESLHHVQVAGLAAAQSNSSVPSVSVESPSLDEGDYVFDLVVGDETRSITVSVDKSGPFPDTNETLLAKTGRQVEAADNRIAAEVVDAELYDDNGHPVRRSSLRLRLKETGGEISFSLADTSGDLIASLGLDRADPGGPADLKFDHLDYTAAGNSGLPLLGGEIELYLYGVTGPDESLRIRNGFEALLAQSGDLVKRYNDYVAFLHLHRADLKPVIANEIMAEVDQDQRHLLEVGISSQGLGLLGLTGAYEQVLLGSPEHVREVLTGPEGFFTGVKGILDEVLGRDLTHYARRISSPSPGYTSRAGLSRVIRTGLSLSTVA